jgi:hypothetical protein
MPTRDLSKETYWRRELADWEKTGLSGAAYCRKRGIPYQQFKDWQKRLRKLDANKTPVRMDLSTKQCSAASARMLADKFKTASEPPSAVEFAEVLMVDSPATHSRAKQTSQQSGQLEVLLPTGLILRLGADCPMELLAAVFSVLENR